MSKSWVAALSMSTLIYVDTYRSTCATGSSCSVIGKATLSSACSIASGLLLAVCQGLQLVSSISVAANGIFAATVSITGQRLGSHVVILLYLAAAFLLERLLPWAVSVEGLTS